MKKHSIVCRLVLLVLFGGLGGGRVQAQGKDSASAPKDLVLSLGYINSDNRVQYLKAIAKTKMEGKFIFVGGVSLRFYIKANSPAFLMGKAVTNEKGEAMVYFPAGVQQEWRVSPRQHFVVTAEAEKGFSAASAEADVVKARLELDTAADRGVVVRLKELGDKGWAPVKGVDVRVAVKRLASQLNIGDAPTYTTDSAGSIAADFKLDSLPGDKNGNLILVASVDDNDNYGSLSVEKTVPWGAKAVWTTDFDRRTLYARRGRSPIWLDFIAYSIILIVWGTIVYLLFQIGKMRRLGRVAP